MNFIDLHICFQYVQNRIHSSSKFRWPPLNPIVFWIARSLLISTFPVRTRTRLCPDTTTNLCLKTSHCNVLIRFTCRVAFHFKSENDSLRQKCIERHVYFAPPLGPRLRLCTRWCLSLFLWVVSTNMYLRGTPQARGRLAARRHYGIACLWFTDNYYS